MELKRRRQNGSVLLVALMYAALFTTLAYAIINSGDSTRERSANLLEWDRRYQYAMAAEVVAVQGLIDDLESDNNDGEAVDHCEERWAVNLPPSPYEDALISATVQDLQGRFNLNWLVTGEDDRYIRNPSAREGLEALLSGMLAEATNASRLSYEMVDWIDSNNLVDDVEGAEDAEYRHRRTPNIPVAHESEMRALRSMTIEALPTDRLFWPYFTALPLDTPLNVNTAPPEVLQAALSFAGPGAGEVIANLRDEDPIKDPGRIRSVAPFSDLSGDELSRFNKRVAVTSNYFQVVIDVQLGGNRTRLVTRIHRADSGETRVVSRQQVPLMGPLEPACNPHYNEDDQSNGA